MDGQVGDGELVDGQRGLEQRVAPRAAGINLQRAGVSLCAGHELDHLVRQPFLRQLLAQVPQHLLLARRRHRNEGLHRQHVRLALQQRVVVPEVGPRRAEPQLGRRHLHVLDRGGHHDGRRLREPELGLDHVADGEQALEGHEQVDALLRVQRRVARVLVQHLRRLPHRGRDQHLVLRVVPRRLPPQLHALPPHLRLVAQQLRAHRVEHDGHLLHRHVKLAVEGQELRVDEAAVEAAQGLDGPVHPLHRDGQVVAVLPVDGAFVEVQEEDELVQRLLVHRGVVRHNDVGQRLGPLEGNRNIRATDGTDSRDFFLFRDSLQDHLCC
mmetsp:Transcript_85481/g.227958  ORF Transcript_85481/g.227958 Transcript_85481/m.227958 type:complete len:325 (+) Transcript_85481:913-1887(+)